MKPPSIHSSLVLLGLCGVVSTYLACHRRPRLATVFYVGNGPPTLVLLHGYGSSAQEWWPFTQTIRWPSTGRFVFPQRPERTVPPDGPSKGRAWWRLDLRSHIPPGKSIPDLSGDRPPGPKLAAAWSKTRSTIDARFLVDLWCLEGFRRPQ